MQALLDDKTTYETVAKKPFGRVERELNSKLLALKNEGKLDERTHKRLHSSDGLHATNYSRLGKILQRRPPVATYCQLHWFSSLQYLEVSNGNTLPDREQE